MNIDKITHYEASLWGNDSLLYISTFSSFNTNNHHDQVYYYTPSGYVVKLYEQAILDSTVECSSQKTKTYTVDYLIRLKNINCKKANVVCRTSCEDAEGTIKVYHQNNFVQGHICETNYPVGFHEEFYEFLRDFIKANHNFGLERVQVFVSNRKGVWINTELLARLYSIFNDGKIFVASN